MKNKKYITVIIALLFIVVLPFFVVAETETYTLLEPLPCLDGSPNTPGITCTNGQVEKIDVTGYLQYLFNIFIAIGAVLAVVMIVWAGFTMAVTDSWQQKSAGKEKLKDAILGLLLVISAYSILEIVNPKFVDIPVSILPPLKNKMATVDLDSVLSSLETDENLRRYSAIFTNAKQEKAALASELQTITTRIQELEKTINDAPDEIRPALQNELDLKKARSIEIKSEIAVVSAKAYMDVEYQNLSNTTLQTAGTAFEKLVSNYERLKTELINQGVSQDKLNDYIDYGNLKKSQYWVTHNKNLYLTPQNYGFIDSLMRESVSANEQIDKIIQVRDEYIRTAKTESYKAVIKSFADTAIQTIRDKDKTNE